MANKEKPRIRPVVIVEGRDDTAAVKAAVEAETIETHGFGISEETWERIRRAYEGPGIIVFTDPDHAGEAIRRRITRRFPGAEQAFLERGEAKQRDEIGVEHAGPEAIRRALSETRQSRKEAESGGGAGGEFTRQDLQEAGLSEVDRAEQRRREVGRILGIGYGNAKTFLRRLNGFGITRAEFNDAVQKTSRTG